MRPLQVALLLASFVLGGCRTFDPKHPMIGAPILQPESLGYWVWFGDGHWHVRLTAGQKPHRFQGSVAGVHGGVVELTTTRPDLKERIAVVGDAVQLDVDATALDSAGFEVQIAGGSCARFDLLVDGKYRAEFVRLGPRASAAHRVPFEKCP